MITIGEILERYIEQTPFLEYGLKKNLINISALARELQPKVEERLMRRVNEGAIIMSIKRFSLHFKQKKHLNVVFKKVPEMIVRSHLIEVTVSNTNTSIDKHIALLNKLNKGERYFLTVTHGLFETTIITSLEFEGKIRKIFKGEIVARFSPLSAITVKLSREMVETPGVYYTLLKYLGWSDISITEVVSTFRELTFIFEEKDVDRAFSVLKQGITNSH